MKLALVLVYFLLIKDLIKVEQDLDVVINVFIVGKDVKNHVVLKVFL
jgi:hypothetical protein